MNIIFDRNAKLFHLYNEKISYIIRIEKNNYLSHCYFGRRIRSWNGSANMYYYDRGFCANPDRDDRTFSLDTMPGEYPDFGQGDFRSPAIELEFEDGDKNTRFIYKDYSIRRGKPKQRGLPHVYIENDNEAMTLEIFMEDSVRGLNLCLYYTIYEDSVITRYTSIENVGRCSTKIHRLLSMSMDLKEQNYDVMTLGGAHTEEKNVYRRQVAGDSIVIESNRGTSSPQATPFWGLMRRETTEEQGEALGINLIYSGNFWGCVQCGQYGSTRVQLGINPFQFEWNLEPGEKFNTPEAVLVYSVQGIGGMSEIFHRLYRNRVCRGVHRDRERPILLNSWEGMYFDINEEKILRLADKAAEAGIELLVIDDGWFKGRNSDTTSLGDWTEDRNKFPKGIQNLAKRVREKGVEVGIWFEPEMISPESELYKQHEDWVIRSRSYEPTMSRNQLVLDLSNPEVCAYLVEAVSQILASGEITYVKWDMNRHLTDLGSAYLEKKKQGELSHRYVLGLYSILEELTERFPKVLFESCSSGGGRFDAGMLYYMPQTWASDNTDAVCRLKIQHGTSILFPAITMGAHISAVPNHQVGRVTALETRYAVAAAGNLGYELDFQKLSQGEMEVITKQIAEYKRIRRTIQFGKYYRLANPFEENQASWNFVSEDGTQIIFVHIQVLARSAYRIPVLRLRGLEPKSDYRNIDTGEIFGGDELMYGGITIPRVRQDFSSTMILFEKVPKE